MKSITGKLSSKNQITIPKTVRDFLGINENSAVQFSFEGGRVYLEKGTDMHVCPFCRGQDFYGEPCLFCEGEGTVETITKGDLSLKLFPVFMGKGATLEIDAFEPFVRIHVNTEDEQLKRYGEHFQLEYIKAELRQYKVKDLLDKDLQAKLTNMLEFETSRKNFVRWWENLLDTHSN